MTVAIDRVRGGGSWLHRMSPIPKLAWFLAGFAVALVTFDPVPLLAIAALAFALAVSAGIAGRVLRGLVPFAPLVASILLIQLLAPAGCRPGCEPLTTLGPLTIYVEGVGTGVSFASRLLAIQVVALVVILTTTSPDLFGALERLRVPRSISFASAMTLQLIPILRRELETVLTAQRARGLRVTGPAALGRSIVPVMVASTERVEQLTISLEARGFGGSTRRTSMRRQAFGTGERALALAGLLAGVLGVAAGLAWWGAASAPRIEVSPAVAVAIAVVAVAVLVGVLARGVVLVLRA